MIVSKKRLYPAAMAAIIIASSGLAHAANPASFTVTVSIAAEANIQVVQGGPVSFGVMAAGDSAVSGSPVIIRNSGSGGSQTYSLSLINPPVWTATTGTPGLDQYRLSCAFDSDGIVSWSAVNHALTTSLAGATGTKFAGDESGAGVPYNADRHIYLKMETPSSTTSPSQKSIQITISASVD